jgi:hypothetical protein
MDRSTSSRRSAQGAVKNNGSTSKPAIHPPVRSAGRPRKLLASVPHPALIGRVAVPAYFGPWETKHWAALVRAKPTAAIVNPASGPGVARDDSYIAVVDELRSHGILPYGYVALGFGQRTVNECLADFNRYRDWYGVEAVFFDEVLVDAPKAIELLRALISGMGNSASERGIVAPTAKSSIVFNPGRSVPVSWFRSFPMADFVTFEGTMQQHRERFGEGPLEIIGPAHRQWHLVHGCVRPQQSALRERLRKVGLGHSYITSDRLPNPWDVFERQGS